MAINAHASFTATAGRTTSPEFNAFFNAIGTQQDVGLAWVTYSPAVSEGAFAYGPYQIGEWEHRELFRQLLEAAKAASA